MYVCETELKETKCSDDLHVNNRETEEQNELDKTILEDGKIVLFENVYLTELNCNSTFKYNKEKNYEENYKNWFDSRKRNNFSETYNVSENICEILEEMRLSDIKYYFRHALEKKFNKIYKNYLESED